MSYQSAKQANGSSNREAKGFLFLLCILIFPFLVQYTCRAVFYEPQNSSLQITYLSDTCEQKKEFKSYSYSNSKNETSTTHVNSQTKVARTHSNVELNAADSATLETLPGIGPAFASRIIKYRTLLGGYLKVEQLKEVYGMPEETYDRIQSLCTVNAAKVKMISADSLWLKPYKSYHPYLSKELKAQIAANKKTPYSEEELKKMIEASNSKLLWYMKW
ncbi:ComEA family DNA-binding protein [Cytophaga aurantiaca]|uniref:ComEA family DNA-binding protein n=1 Tax=Cytophaga aurantiaca TaxID=29530 RepID=UPI00035E494D|nr:helix-hairpin-helix domain-containing protein [Cytophaga aurantiaca]